MSSHCQVSAINYIYITQVDPYPDGNMAIKQYKLDLAQWLATSKDCVVAYMDVKGTPGRGLAFHHWPYKDFTVSHLAVNFPIQF